MNWGNYGCPGGVDLILCSVSSRAPLHGSSGQSPFLYIVSKYRGRQPPSSQRLKLQAGAFRWTVTKPGYAKAKFEDPATPSRFLVSIAGDHVANHKRSQLATCRRKRGTFRPRRFGRCPRQSAICSSADEKRRCHPFQSRTEQKLSAPGVEWSHSPQLVPTTPHAPWDMGTLCPWCDQLDR